MRITRVQRPGRKTYYIIKSGGKQHYLGTDKAGALRRASEVVGVPDEVGGRPQTVAGLIDRWLAATNPSPFVGQMVDMFGVFTKKPLDQVGLVTLEELLEDLRRRGYAASTIRKIMFYARKVLAWGVDHGWLPTVPRMPRLPKPLKQARDVPPEALRKAFQSLPKSTEPILRFLLETGCRPSEACRITWADVDLAGRTVQVTEHKTHSRGKVRVIYLNPTAVSLLLKLQDRGGGRTEFVFTNRLGSPFTPGGLRSVLRRRGIKSVYSLRHTFAQTALGRGVGIEDVAKLLGHANLQTVQTYAQVRDQRAKAVAATLTSPLDGTTPRRRKKRGAGKGEGSGTPKRRTPPRANATAA